MTVNPSEVAEEYRSSLVDLTLNSKPLITMLTMLAEENKDHASVIIGVIEDQILKAPSNQKLPVMYLIDSIVKNVGDHYTRLFANNLVKTFGNTFEKVDERTRKKLYELRQTWNDVFPGSRLYMMDVKVNQLDPAWPITSQQPPGTNIHINPKMINKKMSKSDHAPTTRSSAGKSQFQEITKKKEELLDIEKQKLAMMKKHLEIQAVPKEKKPSLPEPPVEPAATGSKERKAEFLRSYKIKKKPGPDKSDIKGANIYVDPRRMNQVQLPPTAAAIGSRDPRLTSATPDSPVSPRDPRLASAPTAQESSPISDSPTGRVTKTSRPSLPPTSKRPDPRLEKSGEKEKEKDKDKDSSHKKKDKDKDDREKRKKDKDKDRDKNKDKDRDKHKEKEKDKDKDKEKSSRRDKEKSSNVSSLEKMSSRSTIVSHREKDKKDKESSLISSSTTTVVPSVAPVVPPSNLLSPPPGIKPLQSEEETSTVFNKHKSNKGRKQHVRTRRSESPDEATVDTTSTIGSSSSPSRNKKRNRSHEDSESGDSDDYQANKPNPAAYHNKKVRKGEVSSSSSVVLHPTNTSGDTDCGADVDLRQLTPTGKRSAQSLHDENTTPPKKEKLHFEEDTKEAQDPFGLFSGQDVDLRQILAPPNMGPLAPPPGPPELPAVFKGVVDQDLRTSSEMTSQDSLMASINTEEIQVGGHLPNLEEDGVSPTGVVSQLTAVMDSNERKQSFNSPHAAKWKQFREKNPEFKEYQRQASTSDSDRSFHLEGVDEESTNGSVFSSHGRGRGQFRTNSEHRTKRSSTERKRLMYEDEEEGDSSPANNEATKRNYQVIVSQAEEQMQRGEITMSQYNQLLQTVVSLVEQDKIKEARAENKQPFQGNVPESDSDDMGLGPIHQTPGITRGGRGGPFMDKGRGFGRGRPGIDGVPPGGPTGHIGPPGGPIGRGGRGSPVDRKTGHEGMRGHPRMRGTGDPRGGHYMNEPLFDQDYECASEPELPEPSKEDIRFASENIRNQCNIEIDKIMREIHIYGTTAIALMNRDDPRELTFEDGMARIVFEEGKFILPMRIGEPYKEFKIDREPHRIRLGVPTREIFLDGVGHQCFFGKPGKPFHVFLAGKKRSIRLDGIAPNVKIGSDKNFEYCAGKTEMVINAKKVVFLNLDGRPQKFVIDGKIFIIRFIDKLRSVNINGTVFPVEFGGKPICINVKGFRKYLSFQPLPEGIIPGQVSIRNMEGEPAVPHGRPKRHSPARTEGPPAGMLPPGPHPLHPPPLPPTGVAPIPHPPGPSGIPVSGMPPSQPPIQHSMQLGPHGMPLPGPPHILPGPPMPPPWLPPPTNVLPPGFDNTKAPPTVVGGQQIPIGVNMSYNTNVPPPVASDQAVAKPLNIGTLNIGNLLDGLMKVGLIGTKKDKSKDEADEKRLAEEELLKEEENKIPIEVMFDMENLRKRRTYLIHGLYNGMQCSSCGLRYPPEQTVQYSHHLDWHFRQNKRQQESTKKANARRFYFSIEDWLQYEEIEDVDERAPSKFELDGLEEPLDTSDMEIPSIAIDESDESLSSCSVCHDVFNKFYHQDTEEWRYHNATQVEGVNYHPSCHEDLISAQLAEEKAKEEKEKAEAEAAAAAEEADKENSERKEGEKEESEAKEADMEKSEAKEADKEKSEAKEADKEKSEAKEADKEKSEAKEADKEKSEAKEADKEKSTAKEADKENLETKDAEKESPEAMEGVAENSVENSEKDALPVANGVPNKDNSNENSDKDMSTENGDNVESSKGLNVEASNSLQMVRIKEEPQDPSSIPDSSVPLPGGIKIKEEPGLIKVKEEPKDLPEDDEDEYCLVEDTDENLDESWLAPTTTTAVVHTESDMTSTIDGNMELSTPETTAAPASVPRIKISISKPSINNNNNNNDNTNDKGSNGKEKVGVGNSLLEGDDDFEAPPFTVDLDAKPHFRGVELEDMPLQCRGLELSGLCSIM